MSKRSAFFIGATGYIGGSVLVGCLKQYPQWSFTALVRNPDDVPAMKALGPNVNVLLGSQKDYDLVEGQCQEVDIVFNLADADDLNLTNAVLLGLLRAKETSKKTPILIHTSGTGLVTHEPNGLAPEPGLASKAYDDSNVKDIESIGPDQPHRNVDLAIFEAAQVHPIIAYIVAPSTIYGKGLGPVRNISQQVNQMIRTAVQRKQVVHVGPGENVWNNVHITDLVKLYTLVVDLALKSSPIALPQSPQERFFWGSAGGHVWGDVARAIAKRLHARGLVESDVPRSVEFKEVPELAATATNSLTVANRGFALGWKPEGKSLEETLDEEIDLTLAHM